MLRVQRVIKVLLSTFEVRFAHGEPLSQQGIVVIASFQLNRQLYRLLHVLHRHKLLLVQPLVEGLLCISERVQLLGQLSLPFLRIFFCRGRGSVRKIVLGGAGRGWGRAPCSLRRLSYFSWIALSRSSRSVECWATASITCLIARSLSSDETLTNAIVCSSLVLAWRALSISNSSRSLSLCDEQAVSEATSVRIKLPCRDVVGIETSSLNLPHSPHYQLVAVTPLRRSPPPR